MSEGQYSWTIIETVFGGGLLHIALHTLTIGIAAYVIFRALTAYFRRAHLPMSHFVLLSFLPLVTASLGVYICIMFIRAVYFATGLVDPGALPAGIASARLFLYSGWLCSSLSLLAVYAASRTNVA